MNKLIWWVFAGTAGGPNRARIVKALNKRPYNANQLAEKLNLNYTTIRHHLKILTENHMITSTGENKYGELYFLSPKMEENYNILSEILKELS
jgi:DNA-binding transcriptional ArsR family regulator